MINYLTYCMNIVDINIFNNDISSFTLKALRLCEGPLLYTHTYKYNIISINNLLCSMRNVLWD